ncbi:MAG: glycoside hydrolase family 2 protein, partial [Bacteroidota bacterium]
REGHIEDPFWRDNAELCQWPEHWEWHYKKRFDLPDGVNRNWTVIQFDGLDTYSDIFLNGVKLGSTSNMFQPYEYDVREELKEKGNVLEVIFHPPTEVVRTRAEQREYPAAYEHSRVYARRMQATYGWDWVHRFVTMGIWRSCRIVSYPNARIDDLFAYTASISEEEANLKLELASVCKDESVKHATLYITDPNNVLVWERSFALTSSTMKFDADIQSPQLWWPNGAGEQPLYQVTAVLYDARNNELHRKTVETGIRTASLEQIPDKEGHGSSFTIVINGKRIFGKGGNWVPADPFPARVTAGDYKRILGQARDAGMNVLRIWGGGIYEPEEFFHICNQMGIMITQDFMLACADYPFSDPEFAALLEKEFVTVIRQQRNHPSLILWAGDNELGLGFKPAQNWYGKAFHEAVTAPLVAELDPSREFRFTSPMGNDTATMNSLISGDCHLGGQFDYNMILGGIDSLRDYRQFISKNIGRYNSESVAGGIPPVETLLKFMNQEDLTDNYMLDFHMHDPSVRGMHAVSFIELFDKQSRGLYGDPGADNERRLRQLEYIQYEFIRLSMETARARKFWSSGIQFWMFNDCWPAASWSMTDYWGDRKAGWYGAAAGMRPVIAASQVEDNELVWYVTSDMMEDQKVAVEIRIQPTGGGKLRLARALEILVPANSSKEALRLPMGEIKEMLGNDAMLVCEIRYGEQGYDRSYWTPGLPQDVIYPENTLKITKQNRGTEGSITLKSKKWARVVSLYADGVDFEDNYFEMLPGEERTIHWRSGRGAFAGEIKVSSWNE